jgi:hypothetical protein
MKKSELKQIIQEEILKEISKIELEPYNADLLGPQIIKAAEEYARGKAQNQMMEIGLAKAFIAGVLWKTNG